MSFRLRWQALPGWPGRSPAVASKGRRQGPAQAPRLPLRPPRKALIMHWPLIAMHSAPWTNTSHSMGEAAQTARISSRDSSRARMTRSYPSAASSRAPCGVWMLIWVEPCSASVGAISFTSCAVARSSTMTASAPAAATARTACASWGSSVSYTSVFKVTCTRTSRAWQNFTAPASSSGVKFPAVRRALNPVRPRYTASAPPNTAAFSMSALPAGARISSRPISPECPAGCADGAPAPRCACAGWQPPAAAPPPPSWRWPRPPDNP